jgi:hypothetical protein
MGIDRRAAMLHFHPTQWCGWVLALTLGLWAVLAQGEEFRYRYVSLNDKAPPGFVFFLDGLTINDSGQVPGTVFCDNVSCFGSYVAIYKDGAVTVLQPGNGSGLINAGGTIGGRPDPHNLTQTALFHGNQVELVPPQPGAVYSFIIALNDPGTALVFSQDINANPTYVLYKNGQTTVLDFGPTVTNPYFYYIFGEGRRMNNQGIIAGLTSRAGNRFDGARGFRFDPRTGEAELLDPVSPDTLAWGLSINTRGDVLGYSFCSLCPNGYHERIGVWARLGRL